MHSALARVDQGSADALWNAMHTLSFRMTQQRQEMMQLATKQQVQLRLSQSLDWQCTCRLHAGPGWTWAACTAQRRTCHVYMHGTVG